MSRDREAALGQIAHDLLITRDQVTAADKAFIRGHMPSVIVHLETAAERAQATAARARKIYSAECEKET